WALQVAKAVCLLEFLRDLPRTEANIAAFLIDRVGTPAPLAQVQAAVKKLDEAQFLRETEDGWKLMTLPEKNWEKERNELDPRPRDRNEIARKVLREIWRAGAADLPPQGAPQLPYRRGGRRGDAR